MNASSWQRRNWIVAEIHVADHLGLMYPSASFKFIFILFYSGSEESRNQTNRYHPCAKKQIVDILMLKIDCIFAMDLEPIHKSV